jgi:hypothetical protein
MQMLALTNLLNEVRSINSRYEKMAELSGENFNIFKILKVESSETRLHSSFIAELLNPNGTHGLKDQFLKLFMSFFNLNEGDLDTITAKVQLELHIGSINNDENTGGRLDICITDQNNRKIIIENKIYARDQPKQMLRYYKYDKNAHIYYLTLYGSIPDKSSSETLKVGEDFTIISYKQDIMGWLELCREKAVQHAMLRECITQYINLIKYLTNQTINDNMEEELTDLLIGNPQHLKAAFTIANSVDVACDKLLLKLKNEIDIIAEELSLEPGFNLNLSKNYTTFHFTPKGWNDLHIMFQFWNYDKQLVFGLARHEISSGPLPDSILNIISARAPLRGRKVNTWWPYYEPVMKFENWAVVDPWVAISNGEMASFIKENVIRLNELFKDVMF